MLFDINCRLDMCRRQYANDACNRGTAGNFGWTEKHSKPFIILFLPTLFLSLFYVHLFYVFFNVFFSSVNKNKFSTPFFHSKHTKNYIFTHIFSPHVRYKLFQKTIVRYQTEQKNSFSNDLLLFSIQSALHLLFASLCFFICKHKALLAPAQNPVNTSGISWQSSRENFHFSNEKSLRFTSMIFTFFPVFYFSPQNKSFDLLQTVNFIARITFYPPIFSKNV